MSMIKLVPSDYELHPKGVHTGTIIDVFDAGMENSNEGPISRVIIVIKSDTAFMCNDRPFRVWGDAFVSTRGEGTLPNWRENLLGRALSGEEKGILDVEREMIDRRVRYIVRHTHDGDDPEFFYRKPYLADLVPVEQELSYYGDGGDDGDDLAF